MSANQWPLSVILKLFLIILLTLTTVWSRWRSSLKKDATWQWTDYIRASGIFCLIIWRDLEGVFALLSTKILKQLNIRKEYSISLYVMDMFAWFLWFWLYTMRPAPSWICDIGYRMKDEEVKKLHAFSLWSYCPKHIFHIDRPKFQF